MVVTTLAVAMEYGCIVLKKMIPHPQESGKAMQLRTSLPVVKRQVRLVACNANLVVAGAAIDGAIILRQEWDLRRSSALGTNDSVHLAWGALRTVVGATSSIAAS